MNPPAEEVLRTLEAAGGRLEVVPGGVVVNPPELLCDELLKRLKACGRDMVELVRRRATADETRDERQKPGIPSPSPPVATMTSPACELRRFPDWRSDQAIRFCCEPEHRHADNVPTYDAKECDDLIAFAALKELHRLPVAIRNALLNLKTGFGGRIVGSVDRPFGSSRPTGS